MKLQLIATEYCANNSVLSVEGVKLLIINEPKWDKTKDRRSKCAPF